MDFGVAAEEREVEILRSLDEVSGEEGGWSSSSLEQGGFLVLLGGFIDESAVRERGEGYKVVRRLKKLTLLANTLLARELRDCEDDRWDLVSLGTEVVSRSSA